MFAVVRVAIGHCLLASSLAILAMVFPPAHASVATSATPEAATASVVLKPLIVVRQIEVLYVDGSSGADLYGTVKVTDVDGSASSVAFARGEYDSVPVQSWSDAPVSPNGLSAAKLSISVDLWDHWSPVFIPDRPVAQGTIDTRSGHSGLNAGVVRGRGKSAVEITYSKQTSWQKTIIDKVVLKDSNDNPAQIPEFDLAGRRARVIPSLSALLRCHKPSRLLGTDPLSGQQSRLFFIKSVLLVCFS
ncbi:hypothetical protein ATY41_08095 [Leifsonia xyli subsp. xyli]|nr:hypothetical protein [Leifsonia xyli]ODA90866.1 hypothetical protein ATY41_08095 [Leifsonia xyli subsp. xyli]